MPPNSWTVPPRPQPWYPQHSAMPVPPAPLGYAQQPLFPVQNVRPPLPPSTSPALQSAHITPPGLPTSTPPVAVSQPLFPVSGTNNVSTQSSPFLSTSIPSSSPLEVKASLDAHLGTNTSLPSSYQAPNIPGLFTLSISITKMVFLCLL